MRIRAFPAAIVWIFPLLFATAPAPAQDVAAGRNKQGYCASCHGIEGRSFKPNYPILAGLPEGYLLAQLNDFKDGQRRDPNMEAVMPQLSVQDMRDLSAFFASVLFRPRAPNLPSGTAARGKAKARQAGCSACHSRSAKAVSKQVPRIAAQHRAYLAKQLRDFRDGRRGSDAGVMRRVAQPLTDEDIDDLSEYFARLR